MQGFLLAVVEETERKLKFTLSEISLLHSEQLISAIFFSYQVYPQFLHLKDLFIFLLKMPSPKILAPRSIPEMR